MTTRSNGGGRTPEGRERQKVQKAEWRQRQQKKKAGQAAPTATENLESIRRLLEANGVDPEFIGAVKAVRLNEWEVAAKVGAGTDDDPHRLESKTMHAASIVLEPTWATGPTWPLVEPGKPVSVRVPKTKFSPTPLLTTWESALIIPDAQVGYRRLLNGLLDPFHDERVLDLIIQVAEIERPDIAINLGDFEDFAAFSSKFRKEPGFVDVTQAGLDRGVEFLFTIAELILRRQYLISGNHDMRLQNFIIDNAMAAFGLRPGMSPPDTWPDLSIQRLLRLDEAKCEYVGAYPAGAKYLNDNIAAIHGAKLGNAQRTQAQAVIDDERVSIVMGHSHKPSMAQKTRNTRGAPKFSRAYCPGCACRIDGAVPSANGQLDALRRPITAWEDWGQGFAVIRYQPGDGKFHIEDIPVFEGWAMWQGQELQTRVDMYRNPVEAAA